MKNSGSIFSKPPHSRGIQQQKLCCCDEEFCQHVKFLKMIPRYSPTGTAVTNWFLVADVERDYTGYIRGLSSSLPTKNQ